MGFNYLQTDDRDDYLSRFDRHNPVKVWPTFKVSLDGVVILDGVKSGSCAKLAKDKLGATARYLKHGRWKELLTNAGYVVENLKTGVIGPDHSNQKSFIAYLDRPTKFGLQ